MARSRVAGGRQLKKLLRQLPSEFTQEVKDAIEESGRSLYRDALNLMPKPGSEHPYADGTLMKRFKVAISRDGLQARVGSWGKRRAAHITLVEFGTAASEGTDKNGKPFKHAATPAMPFLFPAYKVNRPATVERIRVAVDSALARAVKAHGRDRG